MHWKYNIVKCVFEKVSNMCSVYQARPFEGPAKTASCISLNQRLYDQRERRIILWGTFQKGTDPCTTAREVTSSACGSAVGRSSLEQWLRAKRSKSVVTPLQRFSSNDQSSWGNTLIYETCHWTYR